MHVAVLTNVVQIHVDIRLISGREMTQNIMILILTIKLHDDDDDDDEICEEPTKVTLL